MVGDRDRRGCEMSGESERERVRLDIAYKYSFLSFHPLYLFLFFFFVSFSRLLPLLIHTTFVTGLNFFFLFLVDFNASHSSFL